MLKLIKNIDHKTGYTYSEKTRFIEDTFNEDGYRVPPRKAGVKMFNGVPLPQEMTYPEKGRIADLSKRMITATNMLGYRSGGQILPYTAEHLMNLVQLSPRWGRPFLKKMIKLGVMQVNTRKYGGIESTEYYINPAYFFAGRRISFNLYLLFREHLDPILPQKVKDDFLMMVRDFETSAGANKRKFLEHAKGNQDKKD